MTNDISTLFPESYTLSRLRFRNNLAHIQESWPHARLAQHRLPGDEDLTIDWIEAQARGSQRKVLILTTGEHGVEGFVGSAIQQRFILSHLHRLDPQETGLLLVHTINPWGMANFRRTNAKNVDLNRNFLWKVTETDAPSNPAYARLDAFLNPPHEIRAYPLGKLAFLFHLTWNQLKMGPAFLKETALLGQYRFPKGIHYGGTSIQEETRVIMELYREAFMGYDQLLVLDMHTGYGPRFQMSLVNSAIDERSSTELSLKFGYPLVMAATKDEFYALQGDMIDYLYTLQDTEFPQKRLYATSFEFGTFGDSYRAYIRSLRAMIFENRLYWHGATDLETRQRVLFEFRELFYPREQRWRAKAITDADQAFVGILGAEGYFR